MDMRKTIQLYTDAFLQGLGRIYYESTIDTRFWSDAVANIFQDHTFAVPITTPAHINIHKLEAILWAIEVWRKN